MHWGYLLRLDHPFFFLLFILVFSFAFPISQPIHLDYDAPFRDVGHSFSRSYRGPRSDAHLPLLSIRSYCSGCLITGRPSVRLHGDILAMIVLFVPHLSGTPSIPSSAPQAFLSPRDSPWTEDSSHADAHSPTRPSIRDLPACDLAYSQILVAWVGDDTIMLRMFSR